MKRIYEKKTVIIIALTSGFVFTMLFMSVAIYTDNHFLGIMEILRDSYVWIPCNAVMSDVDQARLLDIL